MLLTERGRRRGPGQRPGGPLPGQSRGRPAVRPAVRLARRADRARRRATTSCSRPRRPRSTGSTSATARRPAAARGSCSSTATRTWNAAEGVLDGLGAQARQAPGAERAAARLDDDQHPDDRPARVDAARRTCATSSRSTPTRGCRGAPSGGSSGRSPTRSTSRRFDPATGRVTQGYGVLQPRITPDAAGRARGARSSSGSSPGSAGIDPYASAVSDVYQDLFQRGQLHRQGDLRRRRVQRGDGGPGARERAAQPRPVRGRLRPGRAGDRRRAVRRVPVELPRLGRPPAPLGAGRLAAAALDPRAGPATRPAAAAGARSPGIARWKMVDNLRRTLSAPLTLATLVAAWTLPSVVGRGCGPAFVVACADRPRGAAGRWPDCCRAGGASPSAATCAPSAATSSLAAAQVGLAHHVPRAPGVADGRRDRAHAGAAVRHPPEPPRVDDRGAGEGQPRPRPGRLLPADGRRRRRSRSPPACSCSSLKPDAALDRGAVRRAVAAVAARSPAGSACRRPSRQPSSSRPRDVEALRLTARRTWRFFETFVGPEDHGLPPDNFQDDPQPVVAHRTSPTNIGMYLLATVTARDFGWIGTHRDGRAARGDARRRSAASSGSAGTSTTGTTRATCAGSSRVRLVGRQRQPRRPPAGARQRLPPDDRPAAPGRGRAGRDRRRDRADPRGGGRDRRRPARPDAHPAAPRRSARAARRRRRERSPPPRPRRGRPAWPSSPRTPGRCRTSPPRSTAERGEGADGELVTWAEAARLAVSSHVRDLALRRIGRRRRPFADDRRARRSAGRRRRRRSRRPRRRSSGGCRRSPTRPSSCSAEMDFGFLFDPDPQAVLDRLPGPRRRRSIRATTTCSRRRRASPASSRSPRATSPPTTGSGSAAR